MKPTQTVLVMMLVVCLSVPVAADAGEWIKPGEEKLVFSGGVFLTNFDSNARIDNSALGLGTDLSLEDDLNLDDNGSAFYVDATWRFAKKHRLSAGYYQFDRDATATANRRIQIGDEIFDTGARLSTDFTFEVVPVAYSYSFMKREKFEFGGSVGLHWTTVDFSVAGSASLGNLDGDARVSADADAPLPLLGLFFDYYFTPRWTAGVHGQAFALDLTDDAFSFSGTLVNFRLNTEYWFFKNVGLGAAINWYSLDADLDEGDWKGTLDYQHWGPQVYAKVRF